MLQGERIIAGQQRLIAELKRDGHDASAAELLLVKFQETQRMHEEDAAAIRKKLEELVKAEDIVAASALGSGAVIEGTSLR